MLLHHPHNCIIQILIYLQLLGSISALFKPGALKLTSIYFCHGLGLIYTLLNKAIIQKEINCNYSFIIYWNSKYTKVILY